MEASCGNSNSFESEILADFKNSPILPVLTCLEKTLKDSKKSYDDKVTVVVTVCQTVTGFIIFRQLSTDVTKKAIEFIYYGTVKIILNSRWLKVDNVTKNHICTTLNKCLTFLQKTNLVSSSRFIISLINLVKDPWGHPTLNKIMTDKRLLEDEIIDFFNRETILLLGLRVKALIDSKSEDLALKLVSFVIQYCGLSINALIHLFIRIISNLINDIEAVKWKRDETKVRKVEKKLCNIFLIMFNMFRDYEGISRECILTAFSLEPTNEIFELIKSCNKRDFSSRMNNNLSVNPEEKVFVRAVGAITPDTGKYYTQAVNYDPYSAPSDIIDECEKLKLSKELTYDLISVISNPRYKRLSWTYDWPKLHDNCEMYLKNIVKIRNPMKELKYLDIDYNQFLER